MTKSRTLRKAGAVVLSLAMAFSVAGVAPSADAAAKVPALSAKKGTIKVGKTKAVKIKNTTAKKVKKLVVSSNKKAVATVKKNSKVKFTVTGKKAGTAKITAKVKLKKKVAGKKVYTLKYTATVKKAATTPTEDPSAPTATPAELALEKVETAAGDATKNILIAYFSSAVEIGSAADIQIRRKDNGQLTTVESFTMSTDKKTATIKLANTSAAGAFAAQLDENVEYTMTVTTTSGKVLEKVFVIPATIANAVVREVDAKNKTIKLAETENGNVLTARGYTLDETLASSVDYFDLIGRTVTVKYNEKGVITVLNPANETIQYGAFKFTAATATASAKYTDLATEKDYAVSGAGGANNKNKYETTYNKYADGFVTVAPGDGNKLAWAKLTLNGDGTVRSVVGINNATLIQSNFVDTVKESSVLDSGKHELNLKDYKIIKDNKLVELATVAKGDIIFASNSANKVAYIYANAVTGKLEANYDAQGFKFAGKNYTKAGADVLKVDGSAWGASFKDLKDAKGDCTLYTSPVGDAVYMVGDPEAETETKSLILVQAGAVSTTLDKTYSVRGINVKTGKIETYTAPAIYSDATTKATPTVDVDGVTMTDTALANQLVDVVVNKADQIPTKINAFGHTDVFAAPTTVLATTGVTDGTAVLTKSALTINTKEVPKTSSVIYWDGKSDGTAKITITPFSDWTGTYTANGNTTTAGAPVGLHVWNTNGDNIIFINGNKVAATEVTGAPAAAKDKYKDASASTEQNQFAAYITSALASNSNIEIKGFRKDGTPLEFTKFDPTLTPGTSNWATTCTGGTAVDLFENSKQDTLTKTPTVANATNSLLGARVSAKTISSIASNTGLITFTDASTVGGSANGFVVIDGTNADSSKHTVLGTSVGALSVGDIVDFYPTKTDATKAYFIIKKDTVANQTAIINAEIQSDANALKTALEGAAGVGATFAIPNTPIDYVAGGTGASGSTISAVTKDDSDARWTYAGGTFTVSTAADEATATATWTVSKAGGTSKTVTLILTGTNNAATYSAAVTIS